MDLARLEDNIERTFNIVCEKYNYIPANKESVIKDIDVIIDTLEELQSRYRLQFSSGLINIEDCTVEDFFSRIKNEIIYNDGKKRLDQLHRYIIIYAKLVENKSTKEISIDGPFFGDVTESEDEAETIAREITDRQQSNVIIKIFERNDRSDQNIMGQARKYFERIHQGK